MSMSHNNSITLQQLLQKPDDFRKEKTPEVVDSQSAYIGPQLWDYTVPLEDFTNDVMNLTEFMSESVLNENFSQELESLDCNLNLFDSNDNKSTTKSSINVTTLEINKKSSSSSSAAAATAMAAVQNNSEDNNTGDNCSSMDNWSSVDFSISPEDLILASVPGQGMFDPARRRFAFDELKPQPILKKAKKSLVPAESKDEKYWQRRQKNNVAAKRSRDARRVKENQIGMRAAFLEKENEELKSLVKLLYEENDFLRSQLRNSNEIGTNCGVAPASVVVADALVNSSVAGGVGVVEPWKT